MSDLWFKNAIIYSIDIDTFMDGNGDGEGDFEGLTQRLDYLVGLGITCIWLLPFFPSPDRDNGYDIIDYYSVDPKVGTLGDFVEFTREANERGIRIIIDLVINHTSDQHPWFQEARRDKHSKYRDYYVWKSEQPEDASHKVIFPGEEENIWSYDEQADAWFLHRFYHHQPELNMANPVVRTEIRKIMGFWLQLGVSGFRVDAAPYVVSLLETNEADVHDPYLYLEKFRSFLSWRRGDAVLLAEANVSLQEIDKFLQGGRRMHMVFNFLVNKHMFLSMAEESAEPITRLLNILPPIPNDTQWANFVRNHDELNLTHLLESEKEKVFRAFAPQENMRIYGRGIRRRFPPMVDGDRRKIELAYSFVFSMPGAPVLYYGEEIGMGDDLNLEGRTSVRTPMQWSEEENAEFSTAPKEKLVHPVIAEGKFAYQKVNVRAQQCDPNSFLAWMERVVRARRESPEFGFGQWKIIQTNHPLEVIAHQCEWNNNAVVAIHNFSAKKLNLNLNLQCQEGDHLASLLGKDQYIPAKGKGYRLPIDGYGYQWFRIKRARQAAAS